MPKARAAGSHRASRCRGGQRARTGVGSPVTDQMLANPSPNDWLSWRRTHDGLGFSPLSSIDKTQRRHASARVVAVAAGGPEHGHAARARRRHLRALVRRSRSGARRRDGRRALALRARAAEHVPANGQAQHGPLRRQAVRRHFGRPRGGARRADGRRRMGHGHRGGKQRLRLERRTARRARQGHAGRERPGSGRRLHRRARCRVGRGGVALLFDCTPGGAGRR